MRISLLHHFRTQRILSNGGTARCIRLKIELDKNIHHTIVEKQVDELNVDEFTLRTDPGTQLVRISSIR